FFRRLHLRRGTDLEWAKLSARHQALVSAYCAGLNRRWKERTPWEFRLLGVPVEEWTPSDVFVLARMIGYVGLAQTQGEIERLLVQMIQAGVERTLLEELFPHVLDVYDPTLIRKVKLSERVIPEAVQTCTAVPKITASNNWVVSGKKTRSGRPI